MLLSNPNRVLGGDAVYLARILLWIDVEDDRSVVAKSMIHKPKAAEMDSFKLYPNPNNGKMQLSYQLKDNESGYIVLLNVLGETVNTYKLTNTGNSINITESELNNGVYFYQIFVNDKRVYSDKIIISK